MGIRINKKMGWIYQGPELPNYGNLSSITLQDLRKENPADKELQMDFCYPKMDLTKTLVDFVDNVSDEDFSEGTDSGSLIQTYIFTPPFVGDKWSRSDDSIDYYDHTGDSVLKIKYLSNEIFPYSRPFVVTKNLVQLTSIQSQQATMFSNYADKMQEFKKKEFEDLGFDLTQNLKSQIHMLSPKIIQLMAEKAGVGDWKSLRPGIITCWR